MSPKPTKHAVSQADKFRGELEAMYTASLVSGLNAQVITEPGWGKTKLSLWMAKQVFNGHSLLMECNPAMQPDQIRGITDMQSLINQGKFLRITTDTPYDPNVLAVILDEVARLSDIAYDLLIHATNDYIRPVRPVFWGTSNFATKGQRTEAFRDRFALNYIPTLTMDKETVQQVVENEDISTWKFNLPTQQEISNVRGMTPTAKSIKAVQATVGMLYRTITETEEGKRFCNGLNPRRIEAWKEILLRASMYFYNSNDFANVHPEAAKLLRFAYPVQDKTEYQAWAQVAGTVTDPAGTAIETIRAAAYSKMQGIGATTNANERQGKMVELGQVKAMAETELAQFIGDKRAEEAIQDLQDMFIKFARGQS